MIGKVLKYCTGGLIKKKQKHQKSRVAVGAKKTGEGGFKNIPIAF